MPEGGYRVGFDVGGTFTDFVLQSPTGELHTAKRLTTYPDPSEACLAGLDELLIRAGAPWAAVVQAVHGTTLGSNIVIERKGRRVGLITTRGFRDVLIIGREKRYQVYDLQIEKPPPLIPRRCIEEVPERLRADGSVLQPLDEAETRCERSAGAASPPSRCACSTPTPIPPTSGGWGRSSPRRRRRPR
jgi:N-methylhydantoinase A/oxoprolinase/acetone carboxylase beta subunit